MSDRSLPVNLVCFRHDGHRPSYNEVLTLALAKQGIALKPNALGASTDFFPMLDDNKIAFITRTLFNCLSGKRTVALFFRPMECFITTAIRYRVKRVLFRALHFLPNTQVLTILPFSVEPRFGLIADDWIHDPQFWDLEYLIPRPSSDDETLAKTVRHAAGDRKVVVAMGAQSTIKGFDYFVRLWEASPDIRERYLFVAAGSVAKDCKEFARRLADSRGLLFDRFVTDGELLALYQKADISWSCYAPHYNQSSGIFGRALQLAKPSIVREGSFLVQIAQDMRHPSLALPFNDLSSATRLLLQWEPNRPSDAAVKNNVERIRRRDIDTLARVLAPKLHETRLSSTIQ